MTKEELETNLAALKLLKNETNDKLESFKQQVKDTEKQLEDYNKPELTTFQLGAIEDLISNAIGDFNFDDNDLYEIEYGLDYDAKVYAENINFRDTYDLAEIITRAVTNFFKEVPNPDDTDTSSGAFIINNPS